MPLGYFIVLLGMLAAFGPLAIDLYLPALPAIAIGLAVAPEMVQWSITIFLAGFALGMLFYGPLSDRYGRRRMMLAGIVLFTIASMGCLWATGSYELIIARFLQALGGGAASVLARAIARDVFSPREAIRVLSLMAMVTAIAPLAAPLLGSFLLAEWGWRGPFAALLAWGLMSLLIVWFWLPETLLAETRKPSSLGTVFSVYLHLVTDPVSIGLLLAGGMAFAAMFAYITGSPFYFIELHGFSPRHYSLMFGLNALGILLANYVNSRFIRHTGPKVMAGIGCLLGFLGALILLLVLGFSHTLSLVMGGIFIVVSMTGLLGANCVGMLMARYPHNAGAAAALFGAAQFGFGMLASGMVSYFYDGTGWPMIGTIFFASTASLAGYLLFRQAVPAGE